MSEPFPCPIMTSSSSPVDLCKSHQLHPWHRPCVNPFILQMRTTSLPGPPPGHRGMCSHVQSRSHACVGSSTSQPHPHLGGDHIGPYTQKLASSDESQVLNCSNPPAVWGCGELTVAPGITGPGADLWTLAQTGEYVAEWGTVGCLGAG